MEEGGGCKLLVSRGDLQLPRLYLSYFYSMIIYLVSTTNIINLISENGLMFLFVFYIAICLQFVLINNHVWRRWFDEKQISRSLTQVAYTIQINIYLHVILKLSSNDMAIISTYYT